MALDDARLGEFAVEGVLAFAEHLMLNIARMWTEASTDQKQRLQLVRTPDSSRAAGTLTARQDRLRQR